MRNWRWPEGGRWSGRDTSCGTVVLQRSLVLSSGPKRQKRTRVGLLCCCFGVPPPNPRCCFGVPRPIGRAGTNSVAIGELFGCKGNFLSAFWKRQPSIASKSSFAGEWRTCLDRRFCSSVSHHGGSPGGGGPPLTGVGLPSVAPPSTLGETARTAAPVQGSTPPMLAPGFPSHAGAPPCVFFVSTSTHTHLLPVHFDRALSFSAIAPVRSTSTVCGFPATQNARVRLYGPLRPYTEY